MQKYTRWQFTIYNKQQKTVLQYSTFHHCVQYNSQLDSDCGLVESGAFKDRAQSAEPMWNTCCVYIMHRAKLWSL